LELQPHVQVWPDNLYHFQSSTSDRPVINPTNLGHGILEWKICCEFVNVHLFGSSTDIRAR